MKGLALVILVMFLLVGCGQKMSDARAEAHKNWNHLRSEAVCAQAVESLRLGQLKRACKLARDALVLDEDYHDARIVLAKACIERGQYAAAAAELQHVLRHRLDSAEALYLLAVAEEKLGNLAKALAEYRSAYELDDSNFHAVLAAAEVLVGMDKPHEARAYLESYLDRADGDPSAYELAGQLAMMDNDYSAATDHYLRACQIDMDNPGYIEALAVAQVFNGRTAEAIPTLTRRAEYRGEPTPAWIYTMLGDCRIVNGELDEAHEAYQKACRLAPDEPVAWVNLAKVLMAMRLMPQAIDAAAKALALDEDCFGASLVMGYALLQTGQADQAVDVLRHTAALPGEDETLLYVLGQAHQAAGQADKARRCYAAAARVNPDNPLGAALLADMSAGSVGLAE